MAIVPKFKDRIIYAENGKEQLFSVTNSYQGVLYRNDNNEVCTMDGNKLGVAITSNTFEVNNLGIIGQSKAEELIIEEDLYINGVQFPNKKSDSNKATTVLLHKEGKWGYENIEKILKEKIENHIKNTYKMIPTGAIHWTPKTLAEYMELHDSHPLKTDYLLCDGRRYEKTKYEKLYNVLYKKTITRQVPHAEGYYYPEEFINGDDNYFYVPDLRHMFMSNTQTQNDNHYTGKYLPDCAGEINRLDMKNHRHYVALGKWNVEPYKPYSTSENLPEGNINSPAEYPNKYILNDLSGTYTTIGNDDYNPTQPVIDAKQAFYKSNFTLKDGDKVGVLPLRNNPYTAYDNGMIGFGSNTTGFIGVNSVPADIFLCRPNDNTPSISDNHVGMSSYDIDSYIKNEESDNTFETVSKGHENYPDFYAMLPLIKI